MSVEEAIQKIKDAPLDERIKIIEELLNSVNEATNPEPFPAHPQRALMDEQVDAYIVMHPELVTKYWGQSVAFVDGKLVDHDLDSVALQIRVRKQYPDKVILNRKVEQSAEPILHVYSPRLDYSA